MKHIFALTMRNNRIFLRDKMTVFFSFLSSIILVALYFLFITKIYTDSIEQDAAELFSMDAANFLVYIQMIAGVLILNSLSLSLGVFSLAARDFETRRVDNFLLTPTTNGRLLLSYFLSGFGVSFTLNSFTWLFSWTIIGLSTGYWLAFSVVLFSLLILLLASLISCSVMMLITSLVRSSTALGVINGILGTLIGFLAGIYIPLVNFGDGTIKVASLIPHTHLTIWLKRVVLESAFDALDAPDEIRTLIGDVFFSAKSIGFLGFDVDLPVMLIFCGAAGSLCLGAAVVVLRKRLRRR